MAVQTGRADIARLLWEFNADFNLDEPWSKDKVCNSDLDMMRLLSEILGASGASGLLAFALCRTPQPDIVRLLLEARADSDGRIHSEERSTKGMTFLGAAVDINDVDSVRALLEFGATVNMPIFKGRRRITPLQHANASVYAPKQEIVHLLLQHGADVHEKA